MFYLQHEPSTIGTEVTIRSTKPGYADKVKSLVFLYNVVTRVRDSWVVQLPSLVTVMITPGPVSVGVAAYRHGDVADEAVEH